MNIEYRINTSVSDQVIVQEVDMPCLLDLEDESRRELLYRRIVNLEEQGIRDALIKLGWTPPPSDWRAP